MYVCSYSPHGYPGGVDRLLDVETAARREGPLAGGSERDQQLGPLCAGLRRVDPILDAARSGRGTSIVRLVTGFESGPPNGPSCTTVSTGLTASSKTGMCWAKSATESLVALCAVHMDHPVAAFRAEGIPRRDHGADHGLDERGVAVVEHAAGAPLQGVEVLDLRARGVGDP